jgi:hypothetical protein
MVAIVSVETVLLVLLVVLVAGLLRSNAEILRRLGAPGDEGVAIPAGVPAPAGPARRPGTPAAGLSGPTPDGDAITLDFAAAGRAPTLLAFLTTGCGTCAGFWETLAEPRLPAGLRTVVVTHGTERERPARLRELAPAGIPVVMSSQAWRDYRVPGAPYFVLVDETIRGEGAATSWSALSSLVGDAIEDAREVEASVAGADGNHGQGNGAGGNGTERAHRVDRTLEAAGIGPDHPSLYPGPPAPRR